MKKRKLYKIASVIALICFLFVFGVQPVLAEYTFEKGNPETYKFRPYPSKCVYYEVTGGPGATAAMASFSGYLIAPEVKSLQLLITQLTGVYTSTQYYYKLSKAVYLRKVKVPERKYRFSGPLVNVYYWEQKVDHKLWIVDTETNKTTFSKFFKGNWTPIAAHDDDIGINITPARVLHRADPVLSDAIRYPSSGQLERTYRSK